MARTKPRPRIVGDREDEILEATLQLLLDVGYDRLTLDGVARLARASKATLYRRWADKASLVVDAMVRARQAPVLEPPGTGSLRGDLTASFCGPHGMAGNAATGMLAAVLTAVASDPVFAERFREAFVAPKVRSSRQIYERAVERGEIEDGLDLDLIVPALAGILMHRSFLLGVVPDDATVERVIDHVILPAVGLPRGPARPDATATPTTQEARTP